MSALLIAADGWCSGALHQPSPNFDARPAATPIDLLVIHNISLPPGQFGGNAIIDFFQNQLDCTADPYFAQLRGVQVSAHFLIRRNGAILQFVSCLQRAWHAGVSEFEGRPRCNDFSIGIELEGTDELPYHASQYLQLAALTNAVQQRYPITALTGHQHIAPGRKTDPGASFDWQHFVQLLKANQSRHAVATSPLRILF